MKYIIKLFRYIEPLWLGRNKKLSLRCVLALAFSINFMSNVSYAIQKWEAGRSMEGISLVLGLEAGLIAGCLTLRTYSATQGEKIQAENPHVEQVNE